VGGLLFAYYRSVAASVHDGNRYPIEPAVFFSLCFLSPFLLEGMNHKVRIRRIVWHPHFPFAIPRIRSIRSNATERIRDVTYRANVRSRVHTTCMCRDARGSSIRDCPVSGGLRGLRGISGIYNTSLFDSRNDPIAVPVVARRKPALAHKFSFSPRRTPLARNTSACKFPPNGSRT